MKKGLFRYGLVLGIVILFIGVNTITISTSKVDNNLFFGLEVTQSAIWDNNMEYIDMVAVQWDESINFDFFLADDFLFENDQEINDVHWIGGYWSLNYSNACYDWYISFMKDDGSGCSPDSHPQTPSFAGPFCYSWEEICKELIEDTGNHIYYTMSVDLPEGVIFTGSDKFWISIWAEGVYPPHSGWGYHYDYMLNPAVLGSEYYNFSFWTPGDEVLGFNFDMCFQLTGWPNLPPSAPIIDGPSSGKQGRLVCFTVHSSDPDEDNKIIRIEIDFGDGTSACGGCDGRGPWLSGGIEVIKHSWLKEGTYEITGRVLDEHGDWSDWSEPLSVSMIKTKIFYNFIFFQKIALFIPNIYKIF